MISFLKLIRYKNLLMVLLTMVLTKYALLDSFIEKGQLSFFQFIVLALSILLITAGGYIINDVFDVTADKINKPSKVFIDVKIPIKTAKSIYYIFSLIGLGLGIFLSINIKAFNFSLIFISTTLGLFFYSKSLKKKVLLGNLVVSVLVPLTIFTVFIFDLGINKGFEVVASFIFVLAYVLFSFLTTLIREIIKDIEDIDGDYAINAKTLPIVIGRKRTNRVAFGFTSVLLIFLIIVLKQYVINYSLFLGYSIICILLPLLYFMSNLWNAKTKKDYSSLSNLMKLIMFFGILSMLFFKFI